MNTLMTLEEVNKIIRALLKDRDDLIFQRDALQKKLDKAKNFHPRAMKLIEKKKDFLVVACDEPYYKEVYSAIRNVEIMKGTWTTEDESKYEDVFRNNT